MRPRFCTIFGEQIQRKRVLIAAGGTGGHLFPAQQLAKMLQDDSEILFAGHRLENSPFFDREKIPYEEIAAHPLGKGFFSAAWKGFWRSARVIRRFSPDVVVGFGSYHTFPVLLAAAILGKKLLLFEANCVLGRVNRLLRFAASVVACQFPLGLKKSVLVPLLPWREREIRFSSKEAKIACGLDPEKRTILVFGGSQGAAFLNEHAPPVIARLGLQAIHLTGQKDEDKVRFAYKELGIEASVKAFETDMDRAYLASDLALSRSGAGTIAELIRFELPAVLVPYPFATEDHQKKNGVYLADAVGGARLVVESEASRERLSQELEALCKEADERKERLRAVKKELRKRTHLADIVRRIA